MRTRSQHNIQRNWNMVSKKCQISWHVIWFNILHEFFTHCIILAHLKGLIDPTGSLPENTVFISGHTADSSNRRVIFGKAHSKVFLSRSPCLEPTDAKLLSVVGTKPKEMSEEHWNELCSKGFGSIFFPRSLTRRIPPLASIIAGARVLILFVISPHHSLTAIFVPAIPSPYYLIQMVILMGMVRKIEIMQVAFLVSVRYPNGVVCDC